MDQNEIDSLVRQGSVSSENERQQALIQGLAARSGGHPQEGAGKTSPGHDARRAGKVMGQITRVTEESEAGTNLVMNFMEQVLSSVGRLQHFLSDIQTFYQENPQSVNLDEVFTFCETSATEIEETIFQAMDAFQFQDINRQKLMKVMYTLAKLNDYLNELLGYDSDRSQEFGHQIEDKTMAKDQDRTTVDDIVTQYQKELEHETATAPPASSQKQESQAPQPGKSEPETPAPSSDRTQVFAADDVDAIIAAFKAQNKA